MLGVAVPGQRPIAIDPARASMSISTAAVTCRILPPEYFDPTKTPTPGNNFVNEGVFGASSSDHHANAGHHFDVDVPRWLRYLARRRPRIISGSTSAPTWIDTADAANDGSMDWAVNKQNYPASPYTDPVTGKRALNLFSGSPFFSSWSSAQIASMESQFASGAVGELEVLANSTNGSAGNTVSFGQLSVVVPEPTSIGLLALSAGAFLRRRRGV